MTTEEAEIFKEHIRKTWESRKTDEEEVLKEMAVELETTVEHLKVEMLFDVVMN